MIKSIQLSLSKIKYTGDSIGDDIRCEIEVLGRFFRVDKRIQRGKTSFKARKGDFMSVGILEIID